MKLLLALGMLLVVGAYAKSSGEDQMVLLRLTQALRPIEASLHLLEKQQGSNATDSAEPAKAVTDQVATLLQLTKAQRDLSEARLNLLRARRGLIEERLLPIIEKEETFLTNSIQKQLRSIEKLSNFVSARPVLIEAQPTFVEARSHLVEALSRLVEARPRALAARADIIEAQLDTINEITHLIEMKPEPEPKPEPKHEPEPMSEPEPEPMSEPEPEPVSEPEPEPVDPKLAEFCVDKEDGNYAFERTCTQDFVVCANGSASIAQCPDGTRYSATEDACLSPTRVIGCGENTDGTLNPCLGRAAGFYAMFGRCNEYVFCADGKPLQLSCKEGYVFDPERSSCHRPSKVRSPCGTLSARPNFDCANKEPGFHVQKGDCRTYYHCDADGTVSSLACPVNYAFDLAMGACRPAVDVKGCMPSCSNELNDFCMSRARDGVFPHPYDCNKGVICLKAHAHDVPCGPERKLFDSHLLTCVEEHTPEGKCSEEDE